jgi:hypothetical protein
VSALVCLLIFVLPLSSQQSPPTATKDTQAISIINQTLSAGGGPSVIGTINDYTAAGNITYYLSQQDVQGTVILRGLGLGEFRLDATLPSGVRTEVDNEYTTSKHEDGSVNTYSISLSPSVVAMPTMPLIMAQSSPGLNVSYKGLGQLNGQSFYQIEIQRFWPKVGAIPQSTLRDFQTLDYFISTANFQILMVQGYAFNHSLRQIAYSNYQPVSGVLLPFTISCQVDSNPVWQIAVSQFVLNSNLQDSDFQH